MNLNISKVQFNKLMKGDNIQLSADSIGSGQFFPLNKSLVKKLMKAKEKGKGMRFSASMSDLRSDTQMGDTKMDDTKMKGSGFLDTVKKVAKKAHVKDGVIDTAIDLFDGKGIFGKTFDKGLKKLGVKKSVFSAAKKIKPGVNAVIDNYSDALIRTHPELAPAVLLAKHATKAYIDTPTKYQKKDGLKQLAKKSLKDTYDEVNDPIETFKKITGSGIRKQMMKVGKMDHPSFMPDDRTGNLKNLASKQITYVTELGHQAYSDKATKLTKKLSGAGIESKGDKQITYINEMPFSSGFDDDDMLKCPHCSREFHGGSFRQTVRGGSFIQSTR